MLRVFHTKDRESAARALLARHRHVLLRNKNMLWQPLRIRKEKLTDLRPYIVMSPAACDAQLEAWNRDGGLLIYDRGHRRRENIVAHGAQVVGECPASVDLLRIYSAGTRGELVVFKPPSWEEHEKWVAAFWPTAETCRKLYALAEAAPRDEPLRAALDLPPCRMLTDSDACKALGRSKAEVTRIRNAIFRTRDYWTVIKVRARIAPPERTLAEFYTYLTTSFPAVDGHHAIVEHEMIAAWWKGTTLLRALERAGSIEISDTVRCYLLDGLPPDWERVDEAHIDARRHLMEMVGYIEESAEFTG